MLIIQPYRLDKNLVTAYNDGMSRLNKGEWAIFLDADAMLMGREHHKIIIEATKLHKGFSAFTCVTNRLWKGATYQLHNGVVSEDHDVRNHWKIGQQRAKQYGTQVQKLPIRKEMSGVCIIYSKDEWLKTPFRSMKSGNFLGVDNALHYDLIGKGKAVGVLLGVYAYHFYRGDGDRSHLNS